MSLSTRKFRTVAKFYKTVITPNQNPGETSRFQLPKWNVVNINTGLKPSDILSLLGTRHVQLTRYNAVHLSIKSIFAYTKLIKIHLRLFYFNKAILSYLRVKVLLTNSYAEFKTKFNTISDPSSCQYFPPLPYSCH